MNDLETFVIDAQDKLWQEDYEACGSEEERETLRQALSEAGDWIYDYDGEQTAKVRQPGVKVVMSATVNRGGNY